MPGLLSRRQPCADRGQWLEPRHSTYQPLAGVHVRVHVRVRPGGGVLRARRARRRVRARGCPVEARSRLGVQLLPAPARARTRADDNVQRVSDAHHVPRLASGQPSGALRHHPAPQQTTVG